MSPTTSTPTLGMLDRGGGRMVPLPRLAESGRPAIAHAVAAAAQLVLDRYGVPPAVSVEYADGARPEPLPVPAVPDDVSLGELFTLFTTAPQDLAEPVGVLVDLPYSPAGEDPLTLRLTLEPAAESGTMCLVATGDPATPQSVLDSVLGHIARVLRAAADEPATRFGNVDILTAEERNRLLVDWNGPEVDYPATTLHRMFAEQAARTPDTPAIVDGDRMLSYRDLDAAANRIARGLRAYVSVPGQVVAVWGTRTIDTLTVKLGVLKAGAAFLYLDPTMPASRTQVICEIAQPVVIVSVDGPIGAATTAPWVDADSLRRSAVSDEPVEDIADETTAAYVLFTSGSSGEPKGVLRSHRMHTTRVCLERELYRFGPGDRHLMKSVPFFREFFLALATGGTVVVARPGGERDDAYLIRLIRDQRISVCSFVPSMLRVLLVNPLMREQALPIRHLFVAGEVFDLDLERQLRDIGLAVHVTYTLAEADYVCHRSDALPTTETRTTVGRPLDMRIYLCDPAGRLRPPGFVGEIYTGGPGIADGYLNRPELTGERFVPNPFDPERAPVLFRTGDLGRFRPDGQLEFAGRADGQVKIRGQRVEPTEVEHVLRRHGNVANALVATLPDPDQGALLVAYLVPAVGDLDVPAVRAFAAEHLPSYLVPTYLVSVPVLPLLGSGKLDRVSLRTALTSRPAAIGPAQPPRDDLERQVARVWCRVLGVNEIGVEDQFTDVGGDSLRAMLLRSALTEELGEPVDLATLLEAPTIRDFADRFRSSR